MQIDELEYAALKADALRYRWVRDRATINDWGSDYDLPNVDAWDYRPGAELNKLHPNFDAAIDAAIRLAAPEAGAGGGKP
jgi:hypothetical protein